MDRSGPKISRRMGVAMVALVAGAPLKAFAQATEQPFMRINLAGSNAGGGGGGAGGSGGTGGSESVSIKNLVINGCSVTAQAESTITGAVFSLITGPAGLSIDPVTGQISGTMESCGSFTLQVSASGGGKTAISDVVGGTSMPPNPRTLQVSVDQYMASGTVGSWYHMLAQAAGGDGNYTYAIIPVSGNLASLMTIGTSIDQGFWFLEGSVIAAGSAEIQIQATDGMGAVGLSRIITIKMYPDMSGPVFN